MHAECEMTLGVASVRWPLTTSAQEATIRELKIHDEGGSTTRSEFQLKNEC
jgi:hypothetical protein